MIFKQKITENVELVKVKYICLSHIFISYYFRCRCWINVYYTVHNRNESKFHSITGYLDIELY